MPDEVEHVLSRLTRRSHADRTALERLSAAELARSPHSEGAVLFAGDGANAVYGFDRVRDGEVVEGDCIGLTRDELIPHGTFADFVTNLAAAQQ